MKKYKYEFLRIFLIAEAFILTIPLLSNFTTKKIANEVENKYNQITDSIDNKYVVIIDNEIKIVEKIKKDMYKDIVSNNIYRYDQITEIKGTLNEALSNEEKEILEIEDSNCFYDEDWMMVYEKVRDKYQVAYCSDIDYKDRYLEIEHFSDKERIDFYNEYYSLLSSEDIYILDTFAANEINFNTSKIDDYYLFIKRYNENNEYDGLELLFDDNYYITIEKGNNKFLIENVLDKDKYNSYNFVFDNNTQALYNINEFCEKKGISFEVKEGYTISELESFIENINEKEIDKIDFKKIYIFDATVSNIDIVPLNQKSDVSSLNVENYYILIQDNEIKNKYSILSLDGNLLKGDIYIDNNSRLISSSENFGFITEVDTSYNLMNIEDFLMIKELNHCVLSKYSIRELINIDNSLKEIQLSQKSKKLI